ncbi:DUF2963 domain-containing protein [Candidatus Phytoplasma pruni]|uniref:DUF2963 domain-containing protein n=1 Tax=Candidatus Phytoplasma pruni TaxID=479893 RepID=A0A851HD20_9MOLU|nr:hypothetical protein [Candidatus Phytoplasma pruni]NWN45878.1 hypothetical protein [Candidatus Phytoplasma pruni]
MSNNKKNLKYPETRYLENNREYYTTYNQTTGRKTKTIRHRDGNYEGETHYHDNGNRRRELVCNRWTGYVEKEKIYDPNNDNLIKMIEYYHYKKKKIKAITLFQQPGFFLDYLKITKYREKEQTIASIHEYTTPSNDPQNQKHFGTGILQRVIYYYHNGKDINYIVDYDLESNKIAKMTFYNPDNSIKKTIHYKRGKPIIPDGEYTIYYDAAETKPHIIEVYRNSKVRKRAIYLQDGTLFSLKNYSFENGEFFEIDEHGNPLQEEPSPYYNHYDTPDADHEYDGNDDE